MLYLMTGSVHYAGVQIDCKKYQIVRKKYNPHYGSIPLCCGIFSNLVGNSKSS